MWSSIVWWDFFAAAEGLGKDRDGKNMLSPGFSEYSKKKAMSYLGHNFFFFLLMWSVGGRNYILHFLYVVFSVF